MFEFVDDGKTVLERGSMIHVDMVDGRLTLTAHLSNFGDADALDEVIEQWDGEAEVCIDQSFSVPGIIDDMIDIYRLVREPGAVFTADDRPMVEAMRAQLLEALEKLDRIKFIDAPPSEPSEAHNSPLATQTDGPG